ncbi:DNA repair protein XRCC2 isoform X1 [Tachyglossus aculeatus]|uniref:DNA repair protein XRCC2 isoform X1 n=1 Tax=Tachyglossus aculeatus TaxID=9261 RepID=UPI0018F5E866|nr:DNA repair protein XRCC2 isoform X1 [Tachyglossus aculeatus]
MAAAAGKLKGGSEAVEAMSGHFRRAESGTELLARLEGRSSLKTLEPFLFADEGFPIHGDILEFHGQEGTGKTEMLYHVVARCILPLSEGGLEEEVLFVDTDYHFDMLRLITILEHRLSQGSEETIKLCLGRLFLVYCSSSVQLLLTLHSLETMFCSHPSLSLLMVDSLSAFYWIDRANGGESLSQQEATLRKCTRLLEKLVKEYHLVLLATTQTIMQRSSKASEDSALAWDGDGDYRPYLCKSWQQLVNHRLFFSKQDNGKDPKQMFSFTSCHLKSNRFAKRFFSIGEGGVQFC